MRRRLAAAYESLGDAALACAHGQSLRATSGRADDPLACPIASDLSWLGLPPPRTERQSIRLDGDLTAELTWHGDADIDLGLVSPNGRYTTWIGGRRGVKSGAATGPGPEKLTADWLSEGRWLIDVVRRDDGTAPVHGTLVVHARDTRRSFRVRLVGRRMSVARVDIPW